jgi:hypothetical protein
MAFIISKKNRKYPPHFVVATAKLGEIRTEPACSFVQLDYMLLSQNQLVALKTLKAGGGKVKIIIERL